MATYYGSKDVGFLLVSGRSVLGSITDVTLDREAMLAATTPIGSTWATYQATGRKQASVMQSGWFDHAVGASNEAICEREGLEQILCVAQAGNVSGRPMFAAQGAFAGKYARQLSGESLHKASATYTIKGYAEDAVILQALATVTSAGNTESASINNGGATTTGGCGYLQVPALTLGGYTNLTIKVRHSADNITFTDLCTFTAVTAVGAEAKEVAGTVNQYLATSRAWTGSGSGQSSTFMVAFARR